MREDYTEVIFDLSNLIGWALSMNPAELDRIIIESLHGEKHEE